LCLLTCGCGLHVMLCFWLCSFAQFFTAPLLTKASMFREMNAVDSEHKKNLQSDDWRLFQLLKYASNHGKASSTLQLTTCRCLLCVTVYAYACLRDACVSRRVCIYVCICMYVCMHGCMYVCMYMCVCMDVCVYVCMRACLLQMHHFLTSALATSTHSIKLAFMMRCYSFTHLSTLLIE
jgi:hypothetical protein